LLIAVEWQTSTGGQALIQPQAAEPQPEAVDQKRRPRWLMFKHRWLALAPSRMFRRLPSEETSPQRLPLTRWGLQGVGGLLQT
jgi:hypothetical protein